MKLAVWSMDAQQGESGSQWTPQRVGRSHIELEQHLEDWIVNDVTLIGEGLTLVGRQVSIDDGRLDLLAVDARDRWVVIEIKPGRLDTGALTQALYYASSFVRLEADELYEKVAPRLSQFGDKKELSAQVKRQLDGEEGEREVALLLVGAGVHAGLERMIEFLGRFGVPVGVVSFEVFELEDGPKIMVREVTEELSKPPSPRRKYTVEAISQMARDAGVSKQFERFVAMAREANLAVQPQAVSVRIAPQADRTRFLMYAGPRVGSQGGELGIWIGAKKIAEWHAEIDEAEAIDMLGPYDDGGYLAGEELNERLDQIERFLTKNFPQPKATKL